MAAHPRSTQHRSVLFTAGSGPRSRRPTRRLALTLSALMIASLLAAPAVASDADAGAALEIEILSPVQGEFVAANGTLALRATSAPGDSISWAVRRNDSGQNSAGTFAGNVDGLNDPSGFVDGAFRVDLDLLNRTDRTGVTPTSNDRLFFVFNPTNRTTRLVVEFSIVDDGSSTVCAQSGSCQIEPVVGQFGQTYTAGTETSTAKPNDVGRIGLRSPDRLDDQPADRVAIAVDNACQDLVDLSGGRLGSDVVHLVPRGFDDGNITVTTTIPRAQINSGTNRGNPTFQICVAPEIGESGIYPEVYGEALGRPVTDTGLVGPILLEDCSDDLTTACIESRERVAGADLVITYRIPAVDPWMR